MNVKVIIMSEDITEDTENSKWIICTESKNISRRIQFVPEKFAGSQVSFNKP